MSPELSKNVPGRLTQQAEEFRARYNVLSRLMVAKRSVSRPQLLFFAEADGVYFYIGLPVFSFADAPGLAILYFWISHRLLEARINHNKKMASLP